MDAAANVLFLQFLGIGIGIGIEAGFSALPKLFPYGYYNVYVIDFYTNLGT